jgi:S-adenosylmethionine:tRNA ribosyltransferase-isomerase
LPAELIAQSPALRREDSKLLVVRREPAKGLPRFEDLNFSDLPTLARTENLNKSKWVRNRTKVFEARIYAKRPTGSVHEIVLLREQSDGTWSAMIRNLKRFDYPQNLYLVDNPEICITCTEPNVIDFSKSGMSVFELCRLYGEMPLPPYIKERSKMRDLERYQSVWANQDRPASVAAPTASLHFSESLCKKLGSEGVTFVDLELNVGLGTFEPLRESNIHQNTLHSEHFSISSHNRQVLEGALVQDDPILCVGTTSMRCLESLPLGSKPSRAINYIESAEQHFGETCIFIKPGTDVLYTSQLLTNFHLPQSSLFVLVSTFAGSAQLALEAYQHAIRKNYRFFSYGDATLWL